MQHEDLIRLRHMLDAATEAVTFSSGRSLEDLDSDRMLLLSLIRCIEIIGEAASKVSDEGRKTTPEIPWKSMIAMRNRLIHAYFDVDPEVVWKTVTMELPALISLLRTSIGKKS
ncbi:MAG: DUF86 domain-containing protein [Thermodesulfovibrionales bacterium]|jgi:uncharacterized protein with HEPN domain